MFTDPLVNLFCDEVMPSVDFYIRHFGFHETFRTPEAGEPVHVEMVLGTFKIAVSAPHDAGPNRTAFLSDPAGHLVSVVSRRDQG